MAILIVYRSGHVIFYLKSKHIAQQKGRGNKNKLCINYALPSIKDSTSSCEFKV